MRIFLKTEDEIQFLRTASHIASCALSEVGRNVVPLSSVGYLKAKATDIVVQLVSSKTQSIRNEQSFHIDLSFFLNGTYNDDLFDLLQGVLFFCCFHVYRRRHFR